MARYLNLIGKMIYHCLVTTVYKVIYSLMLKEADILEVIERSETITDECRRELHGN